MDWILAMKLLFAVSMQETTHPVVVEAFMADSIEE